MGSHLDSVPEGGNYDGLAGVVAGLMCLAKARRVGARLHRPLAVIGLRGEESAWFGKPYLGSYALFGKLSQRDLERKHRDTGRPLAEYMDKAGADVGAHRAGEPLVERASDRRLAGAAHRAGTDHGGARGAAWGWSPASAATCATSRRTAAAPPATPARCRAGCARTRCSRWPSC